jgi:hypothetical protein
MIINCGFFYRKIVLKGKQSLCKERWAALAEREKELLVFVPGCEHQMAEMSSELEEEEDAIA